MTDSHRALYTNIVRLWLTKQRTLTMREAARALGISPGYSIYSKLLVLASAGLVTWERGRIGATLRPVVLGYGWDRGQENIVGPIGG